MKVDLIAPATTGNATSLGVCTATNLQATQLYSPSLTITSSNGITLNNAYANSKVLKYCISTRGTISSSGILGSYAISRIGNFCCVMLSRLTASVGVTNATINISTPDNPSVTNSISVFYSLNGGAFTQVSANVYVAGSLAISVGNVVLGNIYDFIPISWVAFDSAGTSGTVEDTTVTIVSNPDP